MRRTPAAAAVAAVVAFTLLSLFLPFARPARAEQLAESKLPELFDPERHLRVSEVRPGMKGYGLTVFQGTEIERFGVEVISVLRDFNPQYDVVLVRLSGANLEHTGSIAGMSGSPIYLKDGKGRERLVGAFAYGWPLMKDPVGGVQPIEYMLDIRRRRQPNDNTPTTSPATTRPAFESAGARAALFPANGKRTWDVTEAVMLPGMSKPPASYPLASLKSMAPNPRLGADDDNVMRLRPLATPLMTAGLSPKVVEELSPLLRAYGLVPLQAGGIGGAGRADDDNAAGLEPGSVMAVPLLVGDVEMTAVGTCTEIIGDQVFGFGHPFNNEGPVSMPMGGGQINGVIANLMTSFKLGAMGKTYGTLFADEQVGVAGRLGEPPPTIPIDLKVHYADGSGDRHYKFSAAWHPRFTPLLSAAALTSAVTGAHDLPEYHTIDYEATIEFANGEKVRIANSMVNVSMAELFFEFGTPMIAAAQNPFEQVSVKRVEGRVEVTPQARDATILWVNAPRLKFRPGETLKAYVTYRPFRAADTILPIEFELPRDLPEGTYRLTVCGWAEYLNDERMARPFRFSAESARDVFSVIRELTGVRHDAVYVRLSRQADGIAIGRTAMPNLPSSRREVLLGAGRSNVTPYVSSTSKVIPVPHLMSGAAQFEVTIDKNARVETGAGRAPARQDPPVVPVPLPDVEDAEPASPSPLPDIPGVPEPDGEPTPIQPTE